MVNEIEQQMEWIVAECDEQLVDRVAAESALPRIIARLLINRGISTLQKVTQFLNPSLSDLNDPALLPDFDKGVRRVVEAIKSGEKICVHGDYDVDGVTSTALLVRMLSALNANVDYYLPHRLRDGYDIKQGSVDAICERGCGLIITCDCGITACETIERATELGIDVIITDHHEPGPQLPAAIAVINPKRSDGKYPFPELAGVGVAFKFAQGIVRELGLSEESFIQRFVDLTALGTVGDVAPLIGENRVIVKFGIEAIGSSKKIGFRSLLQSARHDGKPLTAYHLAYVLSPRINAVARMDDAKTALKLFLTKDENEARSLAAEMERHNSERKVEQERILAEALEQVESKDLSTTRVLVLSGEGWNAGVVGIVAGRICDAYSRPTIVVNRDPETDTAGGSARSISLFNMIDALRQCEDLLGRFGGHTLAAGLHISLDNLEAFEDRMNTIASDLPIEAFAPRIEVDAELQASDITKNLANHLLSMEPFGEGNAEPVFMSRDLSVVERQRVGDGSHLKLKVRGNDGAVISCIAFRFGEWADVLELGSRVDICYNIRINTFNGSESVQMVGSAIRLSS